MEKFDELYDKHVSEAAPTAAGVSVDRVVSKLTENNTSVPEAVRYHVYVTGTWRGYDSIDGKPVDKSFDNHVTYAGQDRNAARLAYNVWSEAADGLIITMTDNDKRVARTKSKRKGY
jgi:hypothetical protein